MGIVTYRHNAPQEKKENKGKIYNFAVAQFKLTAGNSHFAS